MSTENQHKRGPRSIHDVKQVALIRDVDVCFFQPRFGTDLAMSSRQKAQNFKT